MAAAIGRIHPMEAGLRRKFRLLLLLQHCPDRADIWVISHREVAFFALILNSPAANFQIQLCF
jgi:hypothetical protein